MENGAAVCIPAGIKSRKTESLLVCKGGWNTSGCSSRCGKYWEWDKVLHFFHHLNFLCHYTGAPGRCCCGDAGAMCSSVPACLGHLVSAPQDGRDICGDEKHVDQVWRVSVFQARPGSGLGWVIALGNGVRGWWGRLNPGEKRCWGPFWLLIDVFNERTAGCVRGQGKLNSCQNCPKGNENPWDKREVNCVTSTKPLESGWLICK